jgi:EamA domain-containing membrane protein RarD
MLASATSVDGTTTTLGIFITKAFYTFIRQRLYVIEAQQSLKVDCTSLSPSSFLLKTGLCALSAAELEGWAETASVVLQGKLTSRK